MIKFKIADHKPREDADCWSYPVEELDYLFETSESDMVYLYYDGRLYEAPYLNENEYDFMIKEKANEY